MRVLVVEDEPWLAEAIRDGLRLAAIAADIRARDARDSGRADAPLRVAEGAFVIDTSALSREQAIAAAIEAVETARR